LPCAPGDPESVSFRLTHASGLGLDYWLGGNAAREIVTQLKR